MRFLMAGVALAPFVVLLVGMAMGRARVHACCGSTAASQPADGHRIDVEVCVVGLQAPEGA